MIWTWKSLDFKVKTKDKIVLKNADGSDKELRVSTEPVPPRNNQFVMDGIDSIDDDALDAAVASAEAACAANVRE
eukprot:5150305-Prymnesium_polylepis.1